LCRDEQVDIIYVDLLVMAQYVDPALKIPSFVDLHDSMTLMARRMLDVERNWRRRLALHLHMFRIRMLEGALGRTFNLVVTNSTVDEQVIRELCGATNTLTITNGVDMQYFAPETAPGNNDKVVFTGVMGYAPNEDAAMYFAEEIFPLVKEKRPSAEFWIVGSEPSEKVRALAKMPGVHVTGKVDDVRPYVRSAAVFVSPLRIGSGVKNKILAAMAMKKATVATTLSIDGLNLANNREVLLADEPKDFADKVLQLLTDREAAQQLGANGLARVQGQYSWTAMGEAMDSAIRSVLITRNGRLA
jgi:glycosyltransferase involved in cell wall biosynthesis